MLMLTPLPDEQNDSHSVIFCSAPHLSPSPFNLNARRDLPSMLAPFAIPTIATSPHAERVRVWLSR